MIFTKKSPRYLTIENVNKILESTKRQKIIVGVFMDQSYEDINNILKEVDLDIIQFHGDETKEYCESFGTNYIKAIRIKSDTDLEKINQDYKNAKMLIFDSYDEKEYGGTGSVFDLNLLKDKISIPFLVAGGINESNFQDSLLLENCIGIDVCSSVEERPGIKNHFKVKNLIEKVRSFNV